MFPLILVADQVESPSNIGSLLRLSDAFGVQKLFLCGTNIHISKRALKTSRTAEKTVDYEIRAEPLSVIKELKGKGFKIISIEITASSEPIQSFCFENYYPLVVVVGNENHGISEPLLNHSDAIVHIDMFGKNSSMNVAQATNIALYEITKQFR